MTDLMYIAIVLMVVALFIIAVEHVRTQAKIKELDGTIRTIGPIVSHYEHKHEPDAGVIERIAELGKTINSLVDYQEAAPPDDEELNPTGCTKTTHVWHKRAALVNDHEHVFYCAKGCGSSLRHRFE